MNLLAWLKQRWKSPAAQYTYLHVDPSHVDLGDGRQQQNTPLVSGEHYFRLWLVAMSLANDREWFTQWSPAAYSVVRLKFGSNEETISHIAGQSLLPGLEEGSLGRRVGLNYALTTLAPYNGGQVEIETGLVAVKGRSDVTALLNVLGRFSRLLVTPQLSTMLSAASALADGLAEFLGATDARPVLRVHDTFTGDDSAGANRLRAGYFVVASLPEGHLDPDRLWISRDRPYYGTERKTAAPLSNCDYMLFRLEATRTRDDWEALTSIQQPYQEALQLLQQSAYEADPDQQQRLVVAAERRLDAAKIAALRAPELTRIGGRNQVIDGLLRAFHQTKAALGQGLAEAAGPGTLAAAVSRAMSVNEAVGLGEIPEEDWIRIDGPLPMAAAAGPEPTAAVAGAEPTTAGERAAPTEVRRTPHMDVSPAPPLRPGQRLTVRVFADQEAARPGELVEEIRITTPVVSGTLDLEVWIEGSSHFDFPGTRIKPFVIDLDRPNVVPEAEFEVLVRSDAAGGNARLSANFIYKERASGKVSIEVAIAAEPSTEAPAAREEAPRRAPAIRVDVEAKQADLAITITDPDNTRQDLHCRLSSPHLPRAETGEPFIWHPERKTGDLVAVYMAEFVKPRLTNEERLTSLKGAGRELWSATPKPFQALVWKLIDLDKLETISIVSEDPYFPWELAIPHRGRTTLRPLGSEFTVGRWLSADFLAPKQHLRLSRSLVVAPAYPGPPRPKPLKHAASEAKLVLDAVAGEQVTPATFASVRAKLASGTASLVHFVCHGADSSAFGLQVIELETGQLTSLQLTGMDELLTAFENGPLIFLNACEIGRPTAALVGVGGFASAFLQLGAGAVIAALWSVKDSIAHEVAQDFYKRLAQGGPICPAEVFKEIRRKAYSAETAGEDTYAAYCFYGDPNALAEIAAGE